MFKIKNSLMAAMKSTCKEPTDTFPWTSNSRILVWIPLKVLPLSLIFNSYHTNLENLELQCLSWTTLLIPLNCFVQFVVYLGLKTLPYSFTTIYKFLEHIFTHFGSHSSTSRLKGITNFFVYNSFPLLSPAIEIKLSRYVQISYPNFLDKKWHLRIWPL